MCVRLKSGSPGSERHCRPEFGISALFDIVYPTWLDMYPIHKDDQLSAIHMSTESSSCEFLSSCNLTGDFLTLP